MSNSKGAGAGEGNKSDQPTRGIGGNNSTASGTASGRHGAKRGERIAIGGSKGDATPGNGFDQGGNCADGPSVDKHDQKKREGKSKDIPSNIQASERRHGAGNDASGGHEKNDSKRATRLDMGTSRF